MFVIIVKFSYIYDSQGSVKTHLRWVKYIIIKLLQIVRRVCQWKNFENRSLVGEDMDKSKVPRFYGPPCIVGLPFFSSHADCKRTVAKNSKLRVSNAFTNWTLFLEIAKTLKSII